MAFKKPQVNKIVADISNISIYLRSTKKFGKTTLFRDVIMAKYGDPEKGLLIACGNEQGYSMLDNLNVVSIQNYEDLVDLCNWLVTEKGKEHNIEMIAFDTADELALIADQETIRRSTEETGKKCRSIKSAFGGFMAGPEYSANKIVKPIISGLKNAGFGIWVIAHTKFRTIKEKGGIDDEGYMQLTSNLSSYMESAFGDCLDVVLTGIIDRDMEKKRKTVGQTTKTQNYVTDTVRKLYFRETALIDAGGRFSSEAVPEYMVFDKQNMGEEFITVVEEGIEKSRTELTGKGTPVKADAPTEIAYDVDTYDTDKLMSFKKEIAAVCNDLVKEKKMTTAKLKSFLKENAGVDMPNLITDVAAATKCLELLRGI